MARQTLTLVVPLYNEDHRFEKHAVELISFLEGQPTGSELVFVDDGSVDATADVVEALLAGFPGVPARLVRRPHRGKGAAVRAGLETAATDLAAFCDLDLSTPLSELARIITAAAEAPILAIGSRDLATSTITRHQDTVREILGRAYNRAVQLTVAPGIVDTQCGAKAARTEVWGRLLPRCREDGFAWDVEAIAAARAVGVPVEEVAIEWHHDEGSRVRVLRDGLGMVRALGRIRANVGPAGRTEAAGAGGSVFEADNVERLAAVDATHWWFRSKASYVVGALRQGGADEGWLVDVGAGSAGVTGMIGWPPDRTLAVEGSPELARVARERHALGVARADAERLPVRDGRSGVVCLLDVIEHLADPGPTLAEARRVLGPDGLLVVTVPAHPGLWSAADEVLGHLRRYTRRTLRADLAGAGFEMTFCSHVFSWLLVPVWVKRRLAMGASAELGLDVASPAIDALALVLTRLERTVISRFPLPVGTSILAVAVPGPRVTSN